MSHAPPPSPARAPSPEHRWLLLLHQLPPRPAYFRVKIWRHLQRLGAVAIKNSVYALPRIDQAFEDFQWVRKEIVAGGGDATVFEARVVDGLSDAQIEALFHAARDADYAALADDVRAAVAARARRKRLSPDEVAALSAEHARLSRRLGEIVAIDFFGAAGREAVTGLLEGLERRTAAADAGPRARLADHRGRVWVTRTGVRVDRIASAWLIRRFVDPRARFRFVDSRAPRGPARELRFDMFEAEFTHEGDRCTFEVIVERFGLRDRALNAIAEIIHDIDLKDGKFGRPETEGVAKMIAGICLSDAGDDERLARGAELFENLYRVFHVRSRREP